MKRQALRSLTLHDWSALGDILTGSAGQDWFFASLFADGDDTVLDKITDLGSNEQRLDLDWSLPDLLL